MKKLCFFQFILFFSLGAIAQIPIREYIPSIIKLDTQFHRMIRDSGFLFHMNRWIQEADINNDGKIDLVLEPYMNNVRRDGIVSVFYNQSSASSTNFKNNSRSSFFTLGDPAQFTVGDVNGDGKKDILMPTQNYHGSYPPPAYLYPTGGDQTPDKLLLQRDTGFQRIVFPDNLGTESGNLFSLGNGRDEILVSNYSRPQWTPPFNQWQNLLYKYRFNADTSGLITSTTFNGDNNRYFIRVGSIRTIKNQDTLYNYFAVEKQRANGNGLDSLWVLAFRKADSLNIYTPYDTIASISYIPAFTYGYEYIYRPVNDWGIHIIDLNVDGIKEVITHEFSYYNGPMSIDTAPPHTRIQVYNRNGNVTSQWIDSSLIYDPQKLSHGNGISVVDINGDGLSDILPYTGWGWGSNSYPSLSTERLNKRVFLNTGSTFKAFTLDFSTGAFDFINDFPHSHHYPFPLQGTNSERGVIFLIETGNQNFNPVGDTLSAVPALKLDYSQFKFPCSTYPPPFSLSVDTLLCALPDSALLQIDSVKGYQTRWYKNGALLGTRHFFLARDTGTYNLVITNLGGCVATRLIQVKFAARPSPSFAINSSAQCLTGNSFSFTNNSAISSGTLTSHLWNFGDGGTATTLNATKTYSSVGTYSVKLVSTSNNGCKDSTTRQVTVHPMPVSGFTVNPAIQCLTGNSFSFNNTSTVSGGITTSNWNFGNGSTSTNQSPTFTYANVGAFTVKLVSTSNNGCKDSTTRSVRIDVSPTATLNVAPYRSIHPGLLTTINASIAPAGTYKYTWYRNNQLISNETTTSVDSIGYRLWSGAYKMTVENLPPQLPCSYTTPELVIGDSVSSKLFIYPNPNNGQFRITYYSPTNTSYQVVVMDTKGAVLYRKPHEVTNRYQLIDINLQGASSGLYILQIQDPTGKQLASGQLVIQ